MLRTVNLAANPQLFEVDPALAGTFDVEQLNKERGVRSVSFDWIRYNVPASSLVYRLAEDIRDVAMAVAVDKHRVPVIDARVQRLMPGMFPSIPGWHLDGVARSEFHSQPDVTKIVEGVSTFVCTLSTHPEGVSNTRFLAEPASVEVDDTKPVYKQIHSQLIDAETVAVPDGYWAFMEQAHVHCASPTAHRGYRMFFRVTVLPDMMPKNRGFTDVEQVYLLSEENGW